ncbi:proenkephalin b [Esox lucius]|uniref:Synenkephalin n=1 Tax=Esox lucius TaxID=8010 RepID=A0A3P9AI60_ESOLU|nr:proenkephalin b [Esox lucius]
MPMSVSVQSCWTLALSACLVLTVTADCGADCAYCILDLQLQQTNINSLTCTLECEGALSSKKSWELCEDVLQAKNADSLKEGDQATTTETSKPDNNDPQLLVKKYGGFMKRYGGFMKKTAEVYGPETDDVDHGREILFKRYGGFMKKSGEADDTLSLLRELVRNVDGGGGINKRYGGFMRNARQSSDLENGIQELQKRYGGFMRRVGRPEWREEQKRYGGFLNKRAWVEDEEEEENERVESEDVPDVVSKRYGGFLGY